MTFLSYYLCVGLGVFLGGTLSRMNITRTVSIPALGMIAILIIFGWPIALVPLTKNSRED